MSSSSPFRRSHSLVLHRISRTQSLSGGNRRRSHGHGNGHSHKDHRPFAMGSNGTVRNRSMSSGGSSSSGSRHFDWESGLYWSALVAVAGTVTVSATTFHEPEPRVVTTTVQCDAFSNTNGAHAHAHAHAHPRYRIHRSDVLGEGTFGSVCVATSGDETNERFAAKVIPKQRSRSHGQGNGNANGRVVSDGDLVSVRREQRALRRIRRAGGHPHICGLVDSYETDEAHFVILDLVTGGEMFDFLVDNGAFSEADAARLIREVADALSFLHGLNIVHGDLKPENLLLSRCGGGGSNGHGHGGSTNASDVAVKVVDFGCSRCGPYDEDNEDVDIDNDNDNTNVDKGPRALTPAYCPPETIAFYRDPNKKQGKTKAAAWRVRSNHNKQQQQAQKHKSKPKANVIDPSMDMWSIGIILYIMLTGVHPFDLTGTATDEEIADKLRRGERPPIRNTVLTAHLSDSALNLLEQLIQWDSSKRLTAHQMLSHPWVRGETASKDVMVGSDQRLSHWSRRGFRTRLEASVFADMVGHEGGRGRGRGRGRGSKSGNTSGRGAQSLGDAYGGENDAATTLKTSLIERSFRKFDGRNKGYLTRGDLDGVHDDNVSGDGDDDDDDDSSALSLSGFNDLLSEHMVHTHFQKGTVVYEEGTVGDHMYFIDSGTVEVTTADGSRNRRHRGDFFGEGALLHPQKLRSATVRTVTPVHVLRIHRDYFEKYTDAAPAPPATPLTDDPTSSDRSPPAHSQSSPQPPSPSRVLLDLREKDRTRKRNRAKTILRLQQNLVGVDAAPGQALFLPGQEGSFLYLLEQGVVDVTVDGHVVFRVETPGDLCGEHSLLMDRPRNTAATCVSPDGCRLHRMSASDFAALLDASSPNLRRSLRELCLRREVQKATVKVSGRDFPSRRTTRTTKRNRNQNPSQVPAKENQNSVTPWRNHNDNDINDDNDVDDDDEDEESFRRRLREAFDAVDRTGRGCLSFQDLSTVLRVLDGSLSDPEVAEIVASLDLDETGTVSFEIFERIFGKDERQASSI